MKIDQPSADKSYDQIRSIFKEHNKNIPTQERLIVALDVPTHDDVRTWVDRFGDSVVFYKLGLELLFAEGEYWKLVDELADRGKKVFADIKLYDVPETVKKAVRQIRKSKATFATVHGDDAIMQAALQKSEEDANSQLKILAVTVLTSLDQGDLQDLGFEGSPQQLVLSRAQRAQQLGCDGVICSGQEAAAIRESLGEQLLIITPGIRSVAHQKDDQKRMVDLEQAFENGADYIVVGRPILTAADPKAVAQDYQRRIHLAFSDSKSY